MATKTKKKNKKTKAKAKAKKPSPMPKLAKFSMTLHGAQSEPGKEYTATRIINKRCFMAKVKGGRVSDVFCWIKSDPSGWTWALINRNNPSAYDPVFIEFDE